MHVFRRAAGYFGSLTIINPRSDHMVPYPQSLPETSYGARNLVPSTCLTTSIFSLNNAPSCSRASGRGRPVGMVIRLLLKMKTSEQFMCSIHCCYCFRHYNYYHYHYHLRFGRFFCFLRELYNSWVRHLVSNEIRTWSRAADCKELATKAVHRCSDPRVFLHHHCIAPSA
jgi:hypothetical protein